MSLVASNATEISADELGRLLEDTDAATPLVIVDVRNRDEFDRWRIEGRRPVTLVHTPYFDIIEAVDSDDLAAAAARYAAGHWQDQLSRHALVVTVCARGDGSAFVAEGLRRLGYRAVNLRGGMLAWADRYVTRFVTRSDRLTLAQIARPARGCLSYLIASGGEAAVVDPLRHGGHYEDLAAQLGVRITAVIDTHAHADHISSGSVLARRLGVGYHLHPYDALHPMDAVPGTVPYEPIRDGQTWRVGEVTLQALHVPGHTLGNLVILVDDRYLLTGDTIFVDSVARPDLGGQAEAWTPLHYASLRRLLDLPDDTLVLPGHYSRPDEAGDDGIVAAPLGRLRRENDGLRQVLAGEEAFVAYAGSRLPFFPPAYVDIKRVNLGLLEPDEDLARELELGPNVCALAAHGGGAAGSEGGRAS